MLTVTDQFFINVAEKEKIKEVRNQNGGGFICGCSKLESRQLTIH